MRTKRKDIKLSNFLSPNTKITNKTFTCPSNNIIQIDQLDPYIISEIETLHLNNNKLKTLKGIEQLTFLKQLDISSNPALPNAIDAIEKDQPIDEEIFQFLISKETDIEVFSYEVLNSIKELSDREIKIIFLRNYRHKIDLHSQLKQKYDIREKKYDAEEKNKLYGMQDMIDKLVPHLHDTIEDPNLTKQVKQQAFIIKKQQNETIQVAIENTRKLKQEMINKLIQDIVCLLDSNKSFKQSDEVYLLQVNFKDNTISFSPDKQNNSPMMMMRNQESVSISPVIYLSPGKHQNSFQEITLMNIKNRQPVFPITQNPPIFTKNKSKNENQHQNKWLSNLKTTIKSKQSSEPLLSQKLKTYNNFKSNYQSQLKRIRERSSQPIKKFKYQTPFNQSKVINNYGVENEGDQNSRSKVVEKEREEKVVRRSDLYIKVEDDQEGLKQREKRYISPQNYQSSLASARSCESLTPEIMQTIYFKTLTKVNPMFTLLLSPSTTLNLQQKNQILQALKHDHKQKYFQLLRQKQKNDKLQKQLQEYKSQSSKNFKELSQSNTQIYNDYLVYKQQFEWLQKRQELSTIKYCQLLTQFENLQNVNKLKDDKIGILESNLKKLKDAYLNVNSKLSEIQKQEKCQEIISQRKDQRVRREYLRRIRQRARIWFYVGGRSKVKMQERDKELKKMGFSRLLNHMNRQRIIKWKISQRNKENVKAHFEVWKSQAQINAKTKLFQAQMKMKTFKQLYTYLRNNQADIKMVQLKNIWALRFYTQKTHEKVFKNMKKILTKAQKNTKISQNHYKNKSKKQYFKAFVQLLKENKQKFSLIQQNHKTRCLQMEFKRMIFLIKKQKMQFQMKEIQIQKTHDKNKRKYYIQRFIQRCELQNNFKNRNNYLIKSVLINKNGKYLLKMMEKNRKMMKNMKNKYLKLCQLLRSKIMIRQKTSHDLTQRLITRKRTSFYQKLRQVHNKITVFKGKCEKLSSRKNHNLAISKHFFIKRLQLSALSGKNYIKHRTIQQMQYQMNLSEQKTIQLVLAEHNKYSTEISHLKNKISTQSLRQMQLLQQKDELLLSMNENYEIMSQLKRQIETFRQDYNEQGQKYNSLIQLYNECKSRLQRKQREYEMLMARIMNNIK